jgi:hypothetical protein
MPRGRYIVREVLGDKAARNLPHDMTERSKFLRAFRKLEEVSAPFVRCGLS